MGQSLSNVNTFESNLVTNILHRLPWFSQRFLSFNRIFSSHQLQCHGDQESIISTIYSEMSEEIKRFALLFFFVVDGTTWAFKN